MTVEQRLELALRLSPHNEPEDPLRDGVDALLAQLGVVLLHALQRVTGDGSTFMATTVALVVDGERVRTFVRSGRLSVEIPEFDRRYDEARARSTGALEQELRSLLPHRKLDAIKRLRALCPDMSLQEARLRVDVLVKKLEQEVAERAPRASIPAR